MILKKGVGKKRDVIVAQLKKFDKKSPLMLHIRHQKSSGSTDEAIHVYSSPELERNTYPKDYDSTLT